MWFYSLLEYRPYRYSRGRGGVGGAIDDGHLARPMMARGPSAQKNVMYKSNGAPPMEEDADMMDSMDGAPQMELKKPTRVRKEFPETWLWLSSSVGYFSFLVPLTLTLNLTS